MLTICPTPIGNLDDVSARQRDALAGADIIACEDTRRTGKLLEHLGIERTEGQPRLVPYHEHNEREAAQKLLEPIRKGESVVLVSDAGTPAISDPGYELVRRVVEANLPMTALPGPVAAMVALSASGLPTDAFQFRGFPPSKSGKRRSFLEEVETTELTTILYEAPHRVRELVADIVDVYGADRRICVARELTKMHEEYLRGGASEIVDELDDREEIRGEFVVLIGPGAEVKADDEIIDAKIEELLARGLSHRTIKEVIAELFEIPRSELYERIEAVEESD